jgi:hypothetical protein
LQDQELISHFEEFHPTDLAMEFRPRPGKIRAELSAPKEWRTYHETLHRIWPGKYNHDHNEETELMAAPPDEKIYVVTTGDPEDICYAAMRRPEKLLLGQRVVDEVHLERHSLRPIYGGPTLLEALWAEMDTLMERLMTGQTAEDGGDKFRAQELAWVLAIVTNPYEPSVDAIRAETMRRWEAAEAEAESALDPDQDDFNERPEGADQ